MTDPRRDQIARFVENTPWSDATIAPLAGDASNRRYFRLTAPDLGQAVVMDAPPEKGEETAPFVSIATHLRKIGLSAPEIYETDPKAGFLLIEDLGDDLFSRVLSETPEIEEQLYIAAIDALIASQSAPPPAGLPNYGPAEMTAAAGLALDWYLPAATGQEATNPARDHYAQAVAEALHATDGPAVLVQRDYHAENLLWLPERSGAARVGLLDFQDAALGHPAYDLASLLVDIRREVSRPVRDAGIAHYLARTGYAEDEFLAGFATLSAQRNLRIMGVFTRLCLRDGKARYSAMLPEVWRNLLGDLSHPALAKLRDVVTTLLPEPTQDVVARIRAAHVG